MSCSVLIVEDDTRFRNAFSRAVRASAELNLVGTADDVGTGRAALDLLKPDVLLIDLGLPSGNGIELVRHARKFLPQCDSIVVSAFGDDDSVLSCIQAGATGYLLKDASDHDILQQIQLLRSGASPISPAIARRLLAMVARSPAIAAAGAPHCALSDRELSVLKLGSKGYNHEEIAHLLGLSRHTVGTYLKRVYRKLQVHSATEASYEARKLGLLHD